MWTETANLLGFTSHDTTVLVLTTIGSLLGSVAHITIWAVRSKDSPRDMKGKILGYGFVGMVIGLLIGFLSAGILQQSASAARMVFILSLLAGWLAHRFFKRGLFDEAAQ